MKRNYVAHLTLRSDNAKTGPIPVSVTESASCPPDCGVRHECYAKSGPLAIHWGKVSSHERGMPWEMFCDAVATLPPLQLWRHNAAGDLPGSGGAIDGDALHMLCTANTGKYGFTYTHYPVAGPGRRETLNREAVARANLMGFTVNLSADSAAQADVLYDLGVGPVVCILPSGAKTNTKTPKGRTVVVCPATVREDVSCATCKLCARQRDTVVGFPAHGSARRRIDIRLVGEAA